MTTPEDSAVGPMTDAELDYFYRGFYTVLLRYRAMTLMGWIIVAAGFASLVLGWRTETPHGIVDLALSCLTMFAGVGLVHLSVVSLDTYVRIPVMGLQGKTGDAVSVPAIAAILELMKDVNEGGWQEAYAALRRLRTLGRDAGLPPLSGERRL